MKFVLSLIVILCYNLGCAQDWLQIKAQTGDTRILLLKKYMLTDACSKQKFLSLNHLKEKDFLIKGKIYKMPVQVYKYNGMSIRTTIGITNYKQAVSIKDWNEKCQDKQLKLKSYTKGGKLWVPHYLLKCYTASANAPEVANTTNSVVTHKIFGKDYKNIKIKSNQLKGRVYYLVAGHGGPDPGAIGTCNGVKICEDEYAYDVVLRLGRKLIQHGAVVYIITRDKNDGIRDQGILKCDIDEVTYPNLKMPINQVKRLNQRVGAINKLYLKHKKAGVKYQRMIVIHVDSRSVNSRVDMFFYHYHKSKTGKKVAKSMYQMVKSKYDKYQKGRGYRGTVKGRNLHMLRESLPAGVYIELGNLQNPKDQKRFTIVANREAMAKWFLEALLQKP